MEIFPMLKENQVAVMRALISTGHIVDEKFNVAVNDSQKVFTIYESFDDALSNVHLMLATRNDIEYVIYGDNEKLLKYCSP
jgi:hypothetical protein